MKTAKAALFMGPEQPFQLKEYPISIPKPGYAGLTLVSSGVCGTDVHIHNGKLGSGYPAIIGHEFVGKIHQISPEDSNATGLKLGDYCICDIALTCGHCLLCQEGDDANCLNLACSNAGDPEQEPHFIGGYAEYLFHPVNNLIPIPKTVDAKMASIFACAGPTSLHAFRLGEEAGLKIPRVRTAVVQGLGPVGMFAILYLALCGVPNILAISSGSNSQREKLACSFGATQVLKLNQGGFESVQKQVLDLTDQIGADLVYEASGNPEAFNQGVSLLRNRGFYLVPGQYSSSGNISFSPEVITFKALRILGSSQYSICDVTSYVKLLEKHPEVHEKISSIATTFPLEKINEAIASAKAGDSIKVLLG